MSTFTYCGGCGKPVHPDPRVRQFLDEQFCHCQVPRQICKADEAVNGIRTVTLAGSQPLAERNRLPAHRLMKRVKHLRVGEEIWTVPWALMVDQDMSLWLHGERHAEPFIQNRASMKVIKDEEGYIVDISANPHTAWIPGDLSEHREFLLPVLYLIDAEGSCPKPTLFCADKAMFEIQY